MTPDHAEQQRRMALEAEVREAAESVLAPAARAHRNDRVNRELVRALGSHGLLRRILVAAGDQAPGQVTTATDLCVIRETLAPVSAESETAFALQCLGGYPILTAGRPETRSRWSSIADGDAVAAFALSEPGSGSDAAALTVRATSVGDGWRLEGEKKWISNAPEADVYTVFARTSQGLGSRGITAFAVAGDSPGLSGEPLDMLAPHAIGRLTFDGVPVGPADVLGDVDRGFGVAMRTLDLLRPSVGAFANGLAALALRLSVSRAKTRRMFGGRLGDLQSMSHLLAEMAVRLEAARLLVYSAAEAHDAGLPRSERTRRAAMAKLFATESAQFIIDAAIQIHGAEALQSGHPLEQLYREIRPTRIYEGASEVQRSIIGRLLVGTDETEDLSSHSKELPMVRFNGSAVPTREWRHFDLAIDNRIATITLNRPDKLNALTFEAYADLRDLFHELPQSEDVRSVVLRGEGGAFCSGGDVNEIIGELLKMGAGDLLQFTTMTGEVVRAMRECKIPIVAAIAGVAAGAGSVLALAADFRIVARSAKFAFLFTRVGLAGADMGAAYLLPRLVGLSRATALLILGDSIDAEKADSFGLVHELVDDNELDAKTTALATRLANGPYLAYSQTKSLLTRELDMPLAPALELDATTQALLMTTEDHAEFHAAFNAKRRPVWQGR